MTPAARRAALALALILSCQPLAAQPAPARGWTELKCARYAAAWAEALDIWGAEGLGRDFLDRHAAFVASGCTSAADVCPRSEAELARANAMIVAAMNAGAASTFPPFACRD